MTKKQRTLDIKNVKRDYTIPSDLAQVRKDEIQEFLDMTTKEQIQYIALRMGILE